MLMEIMLHFPAIDSWENKTILQYQWICINADSVVLDAKLSIFNHPDTFFLENDNKEF